MRWFLACALLVVAGCGESEEGQGLTLVTITPPGPDSVLEASFSCWNDPWGDTEQLDSGEYVWFINPTPGPCTLLIALRDENTGERSCVQEEDFVVSPVGDTEVHFTVDDCKAVTMPLLAVTLLAPCAIHLPLTAREGFESGAQFLRISS